MSNFIHRNKETIIFSVTWFFVLLYKYATLTNFGFVYTDSDQTVMWGGLVDFAHNEWHEPRFYGQEYSTMIEAIFAVPFYKLGLKPNFALPIVTVIISTVPFYLLFNESVSQKKHLQAFIIACLPLMLPPRYGLICTMPRGFMTGIFFAAIALYKNNPEFSKKGQLRAGFFSMIAFSVNPNSVLFSLPILLSRLPYYWQNKTLIVKFLFGLAIGFMLHLCINYFYILHPERIIHHLVGQEFLISNLLIQFQDLDKIFNDVCPVFWTSGFLILLLFLTIGIVLYSQRKKAEGITYIFFPLFIIITLGLGKALDGTTSIFFPYSRLYLAIPLVFASCIQALQLNFKIRIIYLLLPVIYFVFHILSFQKTIPFKYVKNEVIAVTKVYRLKESCNKLNQICQKYCIDLILVSEHPDQDLINYGCKVCVESLPLIIRPVYERRFWLLKENSNYVYKNILIMDTRRKLDIEYPDEVTVIKPSFYLIRSNSLDLQRLIHKLRLTERVF